MVGEKESLVRASAVELVLLAVEETSEMARAAGLVLTTIIGEGGSSFAGACPDFLSVAAKHYECNTRAYTPTFWQMRQFIDYARRYVDDLTASILHSELHNDTQMIHFIEPETG